MFFFLDFDILGVVVREKGVSDSAAQNRQTTNNFSLLYTNLQIKLYKNIIITCKGMAMIYYIY